MRDGERDQRHADSQGAQPHESRSKRQVFRRTVVLMLMFGVGLFIPLIRQLWQVSVVDHEFYQKYAVEQQTLDVSVAASRGNIYDAKGNIMAMSATVYDLILSPRDLVASVNQNEFKEDGVPDESAYNAAIQKKRDLIVDELVRVLEADRDQLNKRMERTNSAYEVLRRDIDGELADELQAFIADNKLGYSLMMVPTTKRYYPYASLAAQVLGFCNDEGGAYGLEAWFDSTLEGTPGRVVTAKTGVGTQMHNSYSEYVDAVNGYNLNLTIDTTIQSYVEQTLEEGIQKFDVRNGAFCLVMDPNTGAIKAMASSPDFDPNNYSAILSEGLQKLMEENTESIYETLKAGNTEGLSDAELMEQAQSTAYSDAVNTQWRSKVLDSRYEPGSTFKSMVLAAALEEGVVTESDTFYCSGSVMVPGWNTPISCSVTSGHGTQDLSKAFSNSCNPAFIEIGRRLGIQKFYDYFEAFGFTKQTGIELPGEASLTGAFWDRDKMTNVDLAVASFGQRFEVTPLQMVAAFSAVVNGGYLVKPYIVQSITSQDGAVIQNTEPTIVRQVVSEQTSQRCAVMLEEEVNTGTGKNAYVAGCRIGGKTGSAETNEKGRTIGCAPADDPQVVVLLAYDKPQESSRDRRVNTYGTYISGGNMAAPMAGPLISRILDYMGVEKIYGADEAAAMDVATPSVVGKTVDDAASALEKQGLKYRTVGQGDTVSRQVPSARTQIPSGSSVILYLGDAAPEENATVPNVVGRTYDTARKVLENAGFFMRASGVSTYYTNTTTASSQSIPEGTVAAIGTVVDVQFSNTVEDGAVATRG